MYFTVWDVNLLKYYKNWNFLGLIMIISILLLAYKYTLDT